MISHTVDTARIAHMIHFGNFLSMKALIPLIGINYHSITNNVLRSTQTLPVRKFAAF